MARPAKITVEHEGSILTLAELSRKTGIAYEVLRRRHQRGWRGQDLLRSTKSPPGFANRYRGLL